MLVLVLACSERARRHHPTNLLLLFLFTACQSLLVGAACATYDAHIVAAAFGLTAAVVGGMVLFTLQTKVGGPQGGFAVARATSVVVFQTRQVDLTSMGGVLYSLLLTLMVAGVLQIFIRAPWLHLAICAGGAALFSV